MSPKSKYNRRNISQSKTPAATGESSESTFVSQTMSAKNLKSTSTVNTFDMQVASRNFFSELKWITIVTLIIIGLMVVSYYVFR